MMNFVRLCFFQNPELVAFPRADIVFATFDVERTDR